MFVYYEELAHMIMEADKPQDLWGELEARHQENQQCKFQSNGRKKSMPHFKAVRHEGFNTEFQTQCVKRSSG